MTNSQSPDRAALATLFDKIAKEKSNVYLSSVCTFAMADAVLARSPSPYSGAAERICPNCGRSVDGPTHAAYCPTLPRDAERETIEVLRESRGEIERQKDKCRSDGDASRFEELLAKIDRVLRALHSIPPREGVDK